MKFLAPFIATAMLAAAPLPGAAAAAQNSGSVAALESAVNSIWESRVKGSIVGE